MNRRSRSHILRRVESLESRCLMTAALLQDINTNGPYPTNLAEIGGWTYFRRVEPDGGYALERTNGSGTPQVIEEFPTRTADYAWPEVPQTPVSFAGAIYYVVGPSGSPDFRIEKLDPATGALSTAIPLGPGVAYGIGTANLTTLNGGRMVFTAYDAATRIVSLYGTDGTPGGTSLLASDFTAVNSIARFGSSLLFLRGRSGAQTLWATDGTPAGTRQLSPGDGVINFAVAGDRILYSHSGASTTDPRSYVASIGPDGATQILVNNVLVSQLAGSPDGTGYFSAIVSANSMGIYVTDGTAAGTKLVTMEPTSVAPEIEVHVVAGDQGFFTAYDPATGTPRLWVSDGTAAGTFAATPSGVDVTSGFFDMGVLNVESTLPTFVVEGNRIFFVAKSPSQGVELWTSDGTLAGTHAVADLVPGPEGSHPLDLTVTPDGVLFSGNGANNHPAIYLAAPDGSGIATLTQFNDPQTDSSVPQSSVTIGDTTVFSANSGLWVTNGTPAGTFNLSDQIPGWAGKWAVPVGTVNDNFLIRVGSYNFTYWQTDGTVAGTASFLGFPVGGEVGNGADPFKPGMTAVIGTQTFSVVTHADGSETLQVVDSATGVTTALKSFPSGPSDQFPRDGVAFAGKFYYLIPGGHDRGLYVSDGTAAGTVAVSQPTATSLDGLSVVGNRLTFLITRDPTDINLPPGLAGGDYLLASNGTAVGTYMLSRIGSYTVLDSLLEHAVTRLSSGQFLVFADDGVHGTEPMLVTPDVPPPPSIPTPSADLSAPAVAVETVNSAAVEIRATPPASPPVASTASIPADPPTTTVLSVEPGIRGQQIRSFSIRASGPLDADSAAQATSYRVVRLVTGRHGTFRRQVVPIRSASYDATSHTVTLTLRRRVPSGSFELSAPGLLDSHKRPLNPPGVPASFRA